MEENDNQITKVTVPLPHRVARDKEVDLMSSSPSDRGLSLKPRTDRHGGEIIARLESRGVKPTSTRLLVYRALAGHKRALSLRELDDELDTVDRSTIFRTLTLLLAHHLVHAIEDGTGVAKYEVCEGHDDCSLDDQHIHFFCVSCQRTFCFHTIHIPPIDLPEGFQMQGVNYLVKGLCPNCQPH